MNYMVRPRHQVTKRDEDSSLMQLKEEFRTYEALRREHDAQIVHIAMEAGLRISPEQWSSLLYGDLVHKSHMQSIIDKVHFNLLGRMNKYIDSFFFFVFDSPLVYFSCSLRSHSQRVFKSSPLFFRGLEILLTSQALDHTSSCLPTLTITQVLHLTASATCRKHLPLAFS